MPKSSTKRPSPFVAALRKCFVSAFVVFSFVAYAVHERLTSSDPALSATAPVNPDSQNQGATVPLALPTAQPTIPTSQKIAQSAPTEAPVVPMATAVFPTETPWVPSATPMPSATPVVLGQYRDGDYTGPTMDAFYGLVQVEAVVQNGRLADVKFLQFPNDRRTSQRINSIAMPYLIQEAVQAQSAYINIISGATLTSEAFAQSLDSALSQAKN